MTILKPMTSGEFIMNKRTRLGEEGFILVWALLLMVVMLLLGVSGIGTSIFEAMMSGNEALHKQSFYEADGGTEVGVALLRNNIDCISGFSSNTLDGGIALYNHELVNGTLQVKDKKNFWMSNNDVDGISQASYTNRDMYYPLSAGPDDPHTNIRINGVTQMTVGSSLEMTAGYKGRGKSLGADGASLVYQINTQRIGNRNSRQAICTRYRVDSQYSTSPAEDCYY